MILIIGGVAQGKLDFTKSIGYDPANDNNVIYKLNDIIKDLLSQEKDVNTCVLELVTNDSVVVCDEVGNGIVPMVKEERVYRETVGRVCCEIAKQADEVYRVFCGIGTRLK